VADPPPGDAPARSALTIYTVGHSTHPLPELVEWLHAWQVRTLVDVRTVPRSRTNPQFNADVLPEALAAAGLRYVHSAALGGLRGRRKAAGPSPNAAWENPSFRNYADYGLTPAFAAGLDALLALAAEATCAIMCAEAVWWRCHRRIISDYLLARGVVVYHIMSLTRADPATLTPFAEVQPNGTVRYPHLDGAPAGAPAVSPGPDRRGAAPPPGEPG
jgi:uncharacterized protein (DUF488 family)